MMEEKEQKEQEQEQNVQKEQKEQKKSSFSGLLLLFLFLSRRRPSSSSSSSSCSCCSSSSALLLFSLAFSTLLLSALFLYSSSSSSLLTPWLSSSSASFSPTSTTSHDDYSTTAFQAFTNARQGPGNDQVVEDSAKEDKDEEQQELMTVKEEEEVVVVEDDKGIPHADAPSPAMPWLLNNNPELSFTYGESPAPSIQGIKIPASIDSSSSSTLSDTNRSSSSSSKKCDISVGRWVEDGENYPLYPPDSCPFVDEAFDCQRNGRPDAEYLKWRWEPQDCHIPRFDARNMLEKLRGKRLVFAGDSLMRNQWESMICLLREGLLNKSQVLETSGNRITKGRGEYSFKFLDYNLRVEFYRSHFLMAEGKRRSITGKQRLTLRLDTIDKSSKRWRGADVLVFTTGHWWNHGKTSKGKDYFQEGDTVYSSLPVMVAFRKAVTTWASWVDKNIDPKRTKVFFCGYSPSHFSGGQWNSGGHCHNEQDPIFNETYIPSYPEKMYIIEDIINHMKNPVRILNITRFSEYRKDAHPSIFGQDGRSAGPRREDCSHWCLPGLPDIWNEALHALL